MTSNVLYCVLWILWDIFDLVCIYNVMHVMFGMPKCKSRKRVILYGIIYILISLLHLYTLHRRNIASLLLFVPYYVKSFPVICECLKSNSKGYLLVNIWMYEVVMNFVAESILSFAASYLPEVANNSSFLLIMYFILGLAVLMTILLVKQKRKTKQISIYFSSLSIKTYIFLSFAIFALMSVEGWIFRKQRFSEHSISFLKIMLIILIISFVCLIITLFLTTKEKGFFEKISVFLSEQIENMTTYYKQLNKKDEELRRFKHDSNNLLLGLHSMLENGDIEQAKNYIKSMENMYQSTKREFDSGNYLADAIMSTKKSIANQYNIEMDFQGIIPEKMIKDTDLCIFLTNVLDNAVEACQKLEKERYIHIESNVVKKMWVITISNPAKQKMKIVDNIIETTKKDKEMHGYGLMNMKRVVEKYHGQMKIEYMNDEFVLKASFSLMDN